MRLKLYSTKLGQTRRQCFTWGRLITFANLDAARARLSFIEGRKKDAENFLESVKGNTESLITDTPQRALSTLARLLKAADRARTKIRLKRGRKVDIFDFDEVRDLAQESLDRLREVCRE